MRRHDKARILVVDDSAFVRKKCSQWLIKNGFEVVEATDGIEALAKYVEYKPDVVLLDISMPKMDGIDALHTIMRLDPTARVAMVTALGQRHMVMSALSEGAREFIVKPFRKGRILDTVAKLLDDKHFEPTWE
jgi:two-component system chemotaxis response regulator CheY